MISEAVGCLQSPDKRHILGLLQNAGFRNGYKFSDTWENKENKRKVAETEHTQMNVTTHVQDREMAPVFPTHALVHAFEEQGKSCPVIKQPLKPAPVYCHLHLPSTSCETSYLSKKEQELTITIKQGYNNSDFKTKAFFLFFPHSASKYTFPAHYCKSFEFQHTMSPAL